MYYYGGNNCGYNNSYNGTYTYPMYGYNSNAATVLVLFILLVIILGSRQFINN